MTELSLNLERTIAAPIKQVFDAWLNPELLAKFMQPGEGMSDARVTVDARQGGRFEIIMIAGEMEMPHGGEYLVIDPHNQIVFSWESERSIDGSQVSLDFSETDSGTLLKLSHVKFLDEAAMNDHIGGWTGIINSLDKLVKA